MKQKYDINYSYTATHNKLQRLHNCLFLQTTPSLIDEKKLLLISILITF